ncbi:endonuclease domain-containing protein [uncultured Enterovirga sp.]|uniref:endonuclease domain-containing protein n=1 Tax=uncultured Enterovirga sp. TaxID=2026352 RepID=UPI0035CA025F
MEPRPFARTLRARQTSDEEMLWHQLRGRRLLGSKWRRQVTLGPYIVDFLCMAAKLVVELDGTGHLAQRDYDAIRTREIEAQGFAMLRFSNDEVRTRLDDVLLRIADALQLASR